MSENQKLSLIYFIKDFFCMAPKTFDRFLERIKKKDISEYINAITSWYDYLIFIFKKILFIMFL